MNFILCGDDYNRSDIGLFCKRIQNIFDKTLPVVIYINSIFKKTSFPFSKLSNTTLILNVGNNLFLFSNLRQYLILKAFKEYPERITDDCCIIHDVFLSYPAELLVKSIDQNKLCEELEGIQGLVFEDIIEFKNYFIPTEFWNLFSKINYDDRGLLLLYFVIKRFTKVYCHSKFSSDIIDSILRNTNNNRELYLIPLPYDMPTGNITIPNSLDDKLIVFAIFGMAFNSTKNIPILCGLLLALANRATVKLHIMGAINHEVNSVINKLLTRSDVIISNHGFVTQEKLFRILVNTDFVWAYRNPTHGESSGTVLRAMSLGACPIVADHGWYSELPDNLVLKVSHDSVDLQNISDIIFNNLKSHKELRNARSDYVKLNHSPSQYVRHIQKSFNNNNQLCSQILHADNWFDTKNFIYEYASLLQGHLRSDYIKTSISILSTKRISDISQYALIEMLPLTIFPINDKRTHNLIINHLYPINKIIKTDDLLDFPPKRRYWTLFHIYKNSIQTGSESYFQWIEPHSLAIENLFKNRLSLDTFINILEEQFKDIAHDIMAYFSHDLDVTYRLICYMVYAFILELIEPYISSLSEEKKSILYEKILLDFIQLIYSRLSLLTFVWNNNPKLLDLYSEICERSMPYAEIVFFHQMKQIDIDN